MLVEAAASAPFTHAQPITSVIFDVHSTLIDQGDVDAWLTLALERSQLSLPDDQQAAVAAYLDRVWENARVFDPNSERDLSSEAHQRVFHQLLAQGPSIPADLSTALYATMLGTWRAYDDAVPTLRALKDLGTRIALLSNAEPALRSVIDREGLGALADAVVLSCDIGVVKPNLAAFTAALESIDSTPGQTLMVGDSGNDDVGGTALGLRTLILPRTRGPVHGLALVLGVVRASLDLAS